MFLYYHVYFMSKLHSCRLIWVTWNYNTKHASSLNAAPLRPNPQKKNEFIKET